VVLVGVAAAARGGGLADLLLGEFASEARARGHRDADLVVASDNDAARACYERNGWERRPGEGASVRYRLDLRPPGDGSEPDDRPRR
jgi:ribosomal protein S18 acetylase RimI-like enzyme